MAFFGASRASKIAQSMLIATGASTVTFFVWTKHCQFQTSLDPDTEPLYRSPFYQRYNPRNSPTMSDVCVRRLPLHQIKYEIIDDARNGGGKLVEAFSQGCFGGFNYTSQRLIHQRGLPKADQERIMPTLATVESMSSDLTKADATSQSQSQSLTTRISSLFSSSSSNPPSATPPNVDVPPSKATEPPQHLWSKSQLSTSTYPIGTIISNHFLVLSHTPTSIIVRCGSSPFDSPSSPRNSDGLFELSAIANFEKGYAEFRMTSLFYDGATENPETMGPGMQWLHRQYTKLWMESAVRNVRMSKWRSQEKQIQMSKENMRKEKADREKK